MREFTFVHPMFCTGGLPVGTSQSLIRTKDFEVRLQHWGYGAWVPDTQRTWILDEIPHINTPLRVRAEELLTYGLLWAKREGLNVSHKGEIIRDAVSVILTDSFYRFR